MAPVGPQLPPHLAEKRNRESDASTDDDHAASAGSAFKRARVVGPTLPPAPLDERPSVGPDKATASENESSDDDDFGPALPSTSDLQKAPIVTKAENNAAAQSVKRDDWMTMAPTSGDWSSRMDPTQLKNRKFNTGKGAKAPSSNGGSSDAWHETPEQKQARLQREMMGIKDKGRGPSLQSKTEQIDDDEATTRRLKEYSTSRGPSLYDSHQHKKGKAEDDDPSARAFDREKDIGGGLQVNSTQRRDMMKKASDFGSRFSSAKYL